MSSNSKCRDCDSYELQGHNYCRMCGYYFKSGKVRNARIAVAYNTREKYCGYCGGRKNDCECNHE